MSDSAVEQLNSVKYLYLRQLREPRDNALEIVVEEAVVNRVGVVRVDLPDAQEILENAYPIESVEGCKTFQLNGRAMRQVSFP